MQSISAEWSGENICSSLTGCSPAPLPSLKLTHAALLIIAQCSNQSTSCSTQIAPSHPNKEKKTCMYSTFSLKRTQKLRHKILFLVLYYYVTGTVHLYDLSVQLLKYFKNPIFAAANCWQKIVKWLCKTQMNSRLFLGRLQVHGASGTGAKLERDIG